MFSFLLYFERLSVCLNEDEILTVCLNEEACAYLLACVRVCTENHFLFKTGVEKFGICYTL